MPVFKVVSCASYFLASAALCSNLLAAEVPPLRTGNEPRVAAASNEGELAMKGMQLPPGFKVELFAAEPHLANPVAFDIDRQNRFWVAETFRLHAGVTDIRGKRPWLDEDLAARTVDDRIAMMKRHEGENFLSYEQNSERVSLILDTDGDRKADKSSVFAEGFNTAADGIGSGVLSWKDHVYYADIPNLWLLKDTDRDGVADFRKSLHYGFGVRVGFLGHDLHGLIMGPDGRIYFTVGDRGSNIEVDGKHIGHPDTGCVFRCNPDGSELEVFAYGLRNPQELAFDQYGNLFTGDNNSDGGDRARIVHLIEGSDSGWRVGFQFLEQPVARGPWNHEKMWHPQNPSQPAFLVPPITNLTDGPSGFAFYPGTGLTPKYQDHFFLVDFHGGRSSGIHSFILKPRGAGFSLSEAERFLWNALPTDVAFGPEGGIYFLDWVQGWGMTGKGRIYRLFSPEGSDADAIAETKRLLMEGVTKRSNSDLQKLLAHADMRIRQDAQFELVERAAKGLDTLYRAAHAHQSQLARVHAIRGLTQLARSPDSNLRADAADSLRSLAKDSDPEIRAQIAHAIGDARFGAANELLTLLADPSPRVRMFAAISAGKAKDPAFIQPLLSILQENKDEDAQLRHAAVFGLAGIQDLPALVEAARHSSPSVRMGVLLALRRLERAEIASFLRDAEPRLVLEAARAVNDLPIAGAMRELAALGQSAHLATFPPELLRRVINANYRYGTRDSAKTLVAIATNDRVSPDARAEALNDLGDWEHPSGRDSITGLWRPVAGPRPTRDAVAAVEPVLGTLINTAPDAVRIAAAELAAHSGINSAGDALVHSVRSAGPGAPRVAALRALYGLRDPRLPEVVDAVQNDVSEDLRKEVLRLQSQFRPSGALDRIRATLETGTLGEKQSAFVTLGGMKDKAAADLLLENLAKFGRQQLPREVHVDLLEAAVRQDSPELKSRVEAIDRDLARESELAPFRVSLFGGNAAEGRKIFFERAEAACLRCHKTAGQTGEGGEVGPDLSHIGTQKDREYLLESIVLPNKQIAQGFETLLVTTKDGTSVAGIVKSESPDQLVLNSPEDGLVTLKKNDIVSRQRGLSSMPEGLGTLLSRRDLRDLVEYLASQR